MKPKSRALLNTFFAATFLSSACTTAFMIPEPTYAPHSSPLFRRANCPGNTFQCPTSLGALFADVCCANGQTCAVDNDNKPACCPSGAVCTGTAPSTAPTGTPHPVVSYVANSYFSFPYAYTTFEDSRECTSAVRACSENYDLCTSNLGGGSGNGFPVTIVVPDGGGVTVQATNPTLGASATAVCESLSSVACSNLEATPCSKYGNDAAALGGSAHLAVLSVAIGFATFILS